VLKHGASDESPVLFFLIACAAASADEVLRVSRVVAAAGEGIEQMTFKSGDHEEVLFVKKEAVVNSADVQEAWAEVVPSMRCISIRLKQEGAKKMEAATGGMSLGVERMAIIVEGKVVVAPAVQSKLGAQFIIQGLDDLTDDELKELARKIAGRPPGVPGVDVPEVKRPEQKWESYTDEEYQQIKESREKLGIFYLDKVPSEQELATLLRKGMNVDEVVKALGRPHRLSRVADGEASGLDYMIAPERREGSPDGRAVEDGLRVHLDGGKMFRWSYSYGDAPKELKRVGRQAPSLRMIAPELKLPIEDFDFVDYFERVDVEDPRQTVNQTDLEDLLSLAAMVADESDRKEPGKVSVRADCDLIETMAIHFPEIAALRKNAEGGKIGLIALRDAMAPYVSGRKPLPGEKADLPPAEGEK
jgi:hypothetical protein